MKKAVILLFSTFVLLTCGCQNSSNRLLIGSWEELNAAGVPTGHVRSYGEDGFWTFWGRGTEGLTIGAYRLSSDTITHRFLFETKEQGRMMLENSATILSIDDNSLKIHDNNSNSDEVYRRVNKPHSPTAQRLLGSWAVGPEVSIKNKFIQSIRVFTPHEQQPKHELIEFGSDGTGRLFASETERFDYEDSPVKYLKGGHIRLWDVTEDSLQIDLALNINMSCSISFPSSNTLLIKLSDGSLKGPYKRVGSTAMRRPSKQMWK